MACSRTGSEHRILSSGMSKHASSASEISPLRRSGQCPCCPETPPASAIGPMPPCARGPSPLPRPIPQTSCVPSHRSRPIASGRRAATSGRRHDRPPVDAVTRGRSPVRPAAPGRRRTDCVRAGLLAPGQGLCAAFPPRRVRMGTVACVAQGSPVTVAGTAPDFHRTSLLRPARAGTRHGRDCRVRAAGRSSAAGQGAARSPARR